MSRTIYSDTLNSVRLWQVLIGCAFLSYSVVVFLPTEILSSNLNEFSMSVGNLLKILIPAWLFSTACAVTGLLLIPRRFRFRVLAVVLAIGALLWVQGSFLVWDYGPLDGADINWSERNTLGLVDSILWLAVLVAAIVRPLGMIKVGVPLVTVAMVAQSASLLSMPNSAPDSAVDSSKSSFSISYENKYRFSKNGNVVLIVLDAFQSDIFEEIIEADSKYADLFSGFTYFRDAVAGGNYTELAIPALLTGQTYDNSEIREEFLRDAFLEHGVTTRFKQAGYHVELYPWVGWGNESIFFDEKVASNLVRKSPDAAPQVAYSEKNAKESLHLLDLALFRSVPHFLKRYIHNGHKWFLGYFVSYVVPDSVKHIGSTENQFEIGTFIHKAPVELPADRDEPVFKYFHFKGAHSPLTVNADLSFSDQVFPFSREYYVYQAKANLLGLGEFFSRLKEAGIYENSVIAIVGDHGSGDSSELYIEPPGVSRKPYRLDGTQRNFRRDKARAIPLVLIKRSGQNAPLVTSNAPVASTDLPLTLATELGLDLSSGGRSMFDVDPEENRIRYHGAFEFSPNKQTYVDAITLYRIEGSSWSNESWSVESVLQGGAPSVGE